VEQTYDFSQPVVLHVPVARAWVAVPINAEPVRVGRLIKKSRDPYTLLANAVVAQGLVEPGKANAAAVFFRAVGTAKREGQPLLRAYLRSHSGVDMFGNFLAELLPPVSGL
jgi:hypothetical protein